MSAVNNLLDKYRDACAISSDSAAADSLHIKRQAVHQWRKGVAWPSEDHIIDMANSIGEAPEKWLIQVSAERASPKAKKVWLRLASTAYAASVALAVCIAPARAETISYGHNHYQHVYYVKLQVECDRRTYFKIDVLNSIDSFLHWNISSAAMA